MLISEKKTPKTGIVADSVLVAQGQKCHLDIPIIEISSDDDNDKNNNGDDYIDNHGDLNLSSSYNYPGIEIVNLLLFIKFFNHSIL